MAEINNREIFRLAVPSIIANITTPLLSLVDTAIAGHLGSATDLAAIAVGGSMFNMIYFLFAFLRMGTSGRTAQAFGAQNKAETDRVLGRSLFTAAVFSVAILFLHSYIGKAAMLILDPDPVTESKALLYFRILIFGAPAVLSNYAFYGWLIGMQRSKDTMIISIIVNITNIAVSYTLVYGFDMGISGIATGTLTAQWTGAILGWYIVRKNGFRLPASKGFFAPYLLEKKNKNVNIDIFLRTLCLVGVTVWFTRSGATQGAVMLAVNSLLMQFFIIFSYFMDGFAFAGEALAGKSVGAGDQQGLRTTVSKLLKTGALTAAIFTVSYLFAGDYALNILSDNTEVINRAADYRFWVLAIPFSGFMAFIMDGVFIGMTETRNMLMSLVISAIFFFTILFLTKSSLGNHALWLAFIIYLIVRGIYLYFIYRRKYLSEIQS